jgi:hypothetical protein
MSVLAAAPALPLHSAGKYVAGAYIVFVLLILVYVAIMAIRLSRTERQLVELNRDLDQRAAAAPGREAHRDHAAAPERRAGTDPGREPAGAGRESSA